MRDALIAWTLLFCAAATAIGSDARPERSLTRPSLCIGATGGGRVFSYQWELKAVSDDWAKRWPGWAPEDIQWYWADLETGHLTSLAKTMPQAAGALAQLGHTGGFRHKPHNAPHRWHLSSGYFWATRSDVVGGSNQYTPLLRMPFSMAESRQSGARSPEVLELLSRMLILRREYVQARERTRTKKWNPEEWSKATVDFDFLPESSQRVVLFVRANEELTVWDWTFSDTPKGRSPIEKGEWQKRATLRSCVAEPFHAAAAEGTYFLVTDSGAVYSVQETGGEWKTQTVWKDAAKPVMAMVTQSDGGAAYVFGKDFYFKLAKQVEPKPCRDVTQGPKEVGDPMRTVYQCARVLWEKGELKSTAAQSEPQRQK